MKESCVYARSCRVFWFDTPESTQGQWVFNATEFCGNGSVYSVYNGKGVNLFRGSAQLSIEKGRYELKEEYLRRLDAGNPPLLVIVPHAHFTPDDETCPPFMMEIGREEVERISDDWRTSNEPIVRITNDIPEPIRKALDARA